MKFVYNTNENQPVQAGGGGNPNAFQPRKYTIGGKEMTAHDPWEAQRLSTMAQQEAAAESVNRSYLAGSPDRPEWESMVDPGTGMISNKYQLGRAATQEMSNDYGFQKFQKEAMRDGLSPYAQLMLDQQQLDFKGNLDEINSQYNSGVQSALDRAGAQGGYYAGAGERIGAQSIGDMLRTRQSARRDNTQANLGIRAEDERNRIGQLQNLSGMEMDRNRMVLQGREFDIRNTLNERDAKRQHGMDAWKTDMETWASNKQADAQKSAAGGCFAAGTLIEMASGSKVPIEKLKLGDEVFGGTVTKIISGLAHNADWYAYKGVVVTGSHAVHEDETWIRVRDSKLAQPVEVDEKVYYNLSNPGHMIIAGGILFSDFDEVDDVTLSYEESLIEKNKKGSHKCS